MKNLSKNQLSREVLSQTNDEIKAAYDNILSLGTIDKYSLHRSILLEVDMKKYMSDKGFFNYYGEEKENYTDDAKSYLQIVALGDAEYKRYVEAIDGNIDDYKDCGILIDDFIYYTNDRYEHFNIYNLSLGDVVTGKFENGNNYQIKIANRTDMRPMGLESNYNSSGYLIIPDSLMDKLDYDYDGLYINSSNATKLESDINDYLKNIDYDYYLFNVEQEVNAQKSILLLVAIFLYGFIIVISLIGITNIFNTITTNMNLRSKEFAMLKSIGMTKREFNRLIRLESIFYGTKSLLIGIPLGILGSYAIYKGFQVGNDLGFMLPIQAIIISIVVVFLLIFIIMHVSVKKIDKQNIIETIRNDNI